MIGIEMLLVVRFIACAWPCVLICVSDASRYYSTRQI